MPTLSTAERADLVAAVHAPSITGETTADLYRSPAVSGGKIGAKVLTASGIPIRLRPASQDPRGQRLVALANPVSGARVSHTGKVAAGTDVRYGDELRISGTRYTVEGVGAWEGATLVAMSEIKTV